MKNYIDGPKILTAVIIAAILGGFSWYVTTQIRLNSVEQNTRTTSDLHASVTALMIELKHTNAAVLKNSQSTKEALAKIATTQQESFAGYLALESIATVQKSLVQSVTMLNKTVTELNAIMKYRDSLADNSTHRPEGLFIN